MTTYNAIPVPDLSVTVSKSIADNLSQLNYGFHILAMSPLGWLTLTSIVFSLSFVSKRKKRIL